GEQVARTMNNEQVDEETKQERREKRLKKKRERIPQHGRSLVKIYKDAILKRLKRHRVDK
ncbi:unnamed protein product, partial [marine sediment metagenome]